MGFIIDNINFIHSMNFILFIAERLHHIMMKFTVSSILLFSLVQIYASLEIHLKAPHLLATSVEMRIDLFFALNLVSAPRRLFCDIWPCRGTAVKPRLRSINAVLTVLLQVEQKIIKELPAISFKM